MVTSSRVFTFTGCHLPRLNGPLICPTFLVARQWSISRAVITVLHLIDISADASELFISKWSSSLSSAKLWFLYFHQRVDALNYYDYINTFLSMLTSKLMNTVSTCSHSVRARALSVLPFCFASMPGYSRPKIGRRDWINEFRYVHVSEIEEAI